MQKLSFFSCLLTFILLNNNNLQAQNVNIPDANFKAYLVGNTAINTNADTEIQVSEAAAFNGTIDCSSLNISDLTGIEAFISLTALVCYSNQLTTLNLSTNTTLEYLECSYNQLTSLDLSTNTVLTSLYCNNNQLISLNVSNIMGLDYLYCYSNQLTSLNVSTNTALRFLQCYSNQLANLNVSANTALLTLSCGFNQLTSLDVSTNIALITLYCHVNQLTSLNVSTNTTLEYLSCGSNQLSSLDVSANTVLKTLDCSSNQLTVLNAKNGNNANITSFDATNNPNLTCIQVDDDTYSTTNWTNKDATASYSTICATSINTVENSIELSAYPNPTQGSFSIYLEEVSLETIVNVYDVMGKQIFTGNYTTTQQIDLNLNNAAGVYFVEVQTEKGKSVLKVVKE